MEHGSRLSFEFSRILSNSLESISPAFKWNTRRTQTQNRVCYFHFGPNLSQNHVCSQISQNRGGFSSSGSDSSKKLLTFFVLVLCKFQCLVFETTFTLCFGVCTVSVKESSKLKVSETLLLCNVLALCSNYWLQRLEAMLLCRPARTVQQCTSSMNHEDDLSVLLARTAFVEQLALMVCFLTAINAPISWKKAQLSHEIRGVGD